MVPIGSLVGAMRLRLACCAVRLATEKECVAARLADMEAELATARCGQTQADARIEKLQQYVQVMMLEIRLGNRYVLLAIACCLWDFIGRAIKCWQHFSYGRMLMNAAAYVGSRRRRTR